MSLNEDVLIVCKDGIVSFIEKVVKEHQLKLLQETRRHIREVPGNISPVIIYTRIPLCQSCCFDTLQSLHEKYLHKKEKYFLKIAESLEETVCPNSICDYIYIGIVRDHYNHTPNISTTEISKWTQDAWQIALCYMQNNSRSAKDASLLDLLQLMANNNFILAKLEMVGKSPVLCEEQILDIHNRIEECFRTIQQFMTDFEEISRNELVKIASLLQLINDESSRMARLKILHMIAKSSVTSDFLQEHVFQKRDVVQNFKINGYRSYYSGNIREEGNVQDYKENLENNSNSKLILVGNNLEEISNEMEFPELSMMLSNPTPIFKEGIQDIEITRNELTLGTLTEYLAEVTHQAFLSYPNFQTIRAKDIQVGRKKIRICLERKNLHDISLKYFNVSPKGCDRKLATELVKFAIQNIFVEENCNVDDFKDALDSDMKTMILRSICVNLKKSDDQYIDVYPAKYASSFSNDHEIVLVCFMRQNFDISMERSLGEYRGFKTYTRSYNLVSPESEIVENSYDVNNNDLNKNNITNSKNIGIVIGYHSKRLFEQHSNLEAISISMGKANKDRLDTTNGPCIVVYVRLKYFIPYDESEFEKQLTCPSLPNMKYTVDVREGYYTPLADCRPDTDDERYPCSRTKTLLMGSSIGIQGNADSSATLGPFVEWVEQENIQKCGFLTVCHAFSLPTRTSQAIGLIVIQPARGDHFHKIRSLTEVNNECGKVIACRYQDDIDAAIVEVTARHPTSTRESFIDCRDKDYEDAGIDPKTQYKDGSSAEPESCIDKNVVKFGKVSYLTVGRCETAGTVVSFRNFDIKTTCPHTGETTQHFLNNQFTVREWKPNKREGDGFCKLGDSGSGVFVINEDKSLSCIGMLVGRISDGTAIVTPIQRIIDRFSEQLSQLKLLDFRQDDPQ